MPAVVFAIVALFAEGEDAVPAIGRAAGATCLEAAQGELKGGACGLSLRVEELDVVDAVQGAHR